MATFEMEWKIFWRLTILSEWEPIYETSWRKRLTFKCKCSCWNITTSRKSCILRWTTNSCWCLRKDLCKEKSWSKHPNYWKIWKDSCNRKWWKTILSEIIRWSDYYKEWRASCLKRDWYKCQLSWKTWKLNVHHFSPLNIIIDDLDHTNYIDSDILFDIDNWITILSEYHEQFHKEYWYRKFNKEDFIEFRDKHFN